MKLVYTNQNQLFVGNAKNLVEGAGIPVMVKNEFLSSGFGELSGADTWPELWVMEDADYPKALSIVESLSKLSEAGSWTCSNCDEINDASFELCWNCQKASQ